jgi:uncharacterized protein with von Willebrand factor type A (vWA) domain
VTGSATPAGDVVSSVLGSIVGFAGSLREAGVDASPERVQAMVEALASLDAASARDLYWSGRLTLCSEPDDIPRYDRAFASWFAGAPAPARHAVTTLTVPREVALPVDANADGDTDGEPSSLATASRVEVLRHRDVASVTEGEREELRRMLEMLRAPAPQRRSRRMRPAPTGPVDPHRTVRAMLERGGEPVRLHRRRHGARPRRLVLLLDVSGSMAAYADTLLRYAHAVVRRRPRTEVFTLGTRLTRVTRELAGRDVEGALAALSAVVEDWSGGTRLGADLKDFLDRYGQRGMARGAVVVVASDGWEQGDPALLGEQMARLRRLAHRVVWVHPHKARAGYEPLTAGMRAALPNVDDFVAGHSVAAFDELSGLISDDRWTRRLRA